MTATEASRNFSALLNRVIDGDTVEITRSGIVIAVIGPPHPTKKYFLSPDEFRDLIERLPPVDEDFVRDLEAIRKESGTYQW
jgi:prevent-host-death family protein